MAWDNTAPSAMSVAALSWDNTRPTAMTVAGVTFNNQPPVARTASGETETSVYSSSFASGTDGWSAVGTGVSLAGNIDSIGGLNDCLRLTWQLSGAGYIEKSSIGLTAGRYHIRGRVFIPTANSYLGNGVFDICLAPNDSGNYADHLVIENVVEGSAWQWFEADFVSDGTVDYLAIGVFSGSVINGDLLYFRDLTITRIS